MTRPVRARALPGWLTAEAISLLGTRVSMVALPLFVLLDTGSATRTGLVALAETAPLVLAKVLGGPVIDRVGARRVAIGCDLGSVLAVGAIPLLHHLGALPFGLLLAIVAVAGTLRGPGDAAKQALVPAIATAAEVPLERVTGLAGTVERTASMLGAALGAALVTTIGGAEALALDALSFALSAAVLAWSTRGLPTPRGAGPTGPTGAAPDPTPYVAQLREGFAFLRGDRVLLAITVMVALTNLLDAAWSSVLVPVWAVTSEGGEAAVGILFAVFSGASALGALCAATWAARLPRYRTYLVAFLVAGAPRFVVMALDAPLWSVLAVAVGAGFAAGFLNPVLGAVIFERIPAELTGRVSSLTTAMCFALLPFGGLLGGLLVSGPGLGFALGACGAAYLAVTVLPALDPRWRELDVRPEPVMATSSAAHR